MAAIVHLAGDDGLLEAASRVRAAPDAEELVLAVPEDAPVLANPLFLRVLRGLRPATRLVLVTADARGRAFASGVRLPTFASLAAYEQKSVDPTERLERARLAALALLGQERALRRVRMRRAIALVVAAAVLLLAVAPSAQVDVTANETAVAPVELEVVAGPSAPLKAARLQEDVSATVSGTATGSKIDKTPAKGIERFTNVSTDTVEIPVGTLVWTSARVQFRTTQSKTLPPSRIFPGLFFSRVDIPIEAVEAGTTGNVRADSITIVESRRLSVTNPQATSGGDEQRSPVVLMADYTTATAALDRAVDAKAQEKLRVWAAGVPAGQRVEQTYASRTLSRTPSAEVVDQQRSSFELSATVKITAFAVPQDEPRATALRGLADALAPDHELAPSTVRVDSLGTVATEEGVRWRLRASASERARVDAAALQVALAGQERESAGPLLKRRGITLHALTTFPSWWPRMPLVPLRIDVRSGERAASVP